MRPIHITSVLLVTCLLSITVTAKSTLQPDTIFLHFSAADYTLHEDEMPEVSYIYSLPEGTTHDKEDFSVSIEYPEYASLTSEEVKIAGMHQASLQDNIVPKWNISTMRKRQQLDITFCPIVYTAGKYRRLTSCKIAVYNKRANTLRHRVSTEHTERYAQHSVLSAGRWVKIGITNEGMYEVTADKLREWGFSDIKRVKLYGYGGQILPEKLDFNAESGLIDDLNEVPLYRNGQKVMFYANGIIRWDLNTSTDRYTHTENYYSKQGYYFLTEGDNPLEIEETPKLEVQGHTSTVSTVRGYNVYEGSSFLWYEGGRRLFDSYDFAQGSTHSFRLDAPGFATDAAQESYIEVAFSASNPISSTSANVSINGKSIGSLSVSKFGNNENARVTNKSFKITEGLSPTNNITIVTNNRNNARLDYIRLNYPRALDASSDAFSFIASSREATSLSIKNADSGTQVWKLPHGKNTLSRVSGTLTGTTLVTEPIPSNTRFALVNVNRTYPTPTYIGVVENQDLHGDGPQDMVIVTPSSGKLDQQAQRLADLHIQNDGMRVRVVRARNIYNEFSSGTPDATAVRRYMKMLYDRAETEEDMPKFLILFGNSLADNRMLTESLKKENPDDFLLCYEVDGNASSVGTLYSYCTDDYFGMLDDNEGASITTDKTDLGIGRFCCYNADEARILVDKVEKYLNKENAGIWQNDILLMGDYGDSNSHMEDAERVNEAIYKGNKFLNVEKLYPDTYVWKVSATGNTFPQATQRLETLLKKGVSMVNYSGHGSPNQLSHAWLSSTAHLATINNKHLPLWVLASCEIFPIDSEEDNLGRMSMLKTDGGAIGFICATRSVYASYNNPFNQRVSAYLTNRQDKTGGTFGEALMKAKNDMISNSTDMTMNKLKYVLIGDPALRLPIPKEDVHLDYIGDTFVGDNNASNIQLKAGSMIRFSGHVDGVQEGQLTLRIYDSSRQITCINNAQDDVDPYIYEGLGASVFTGNAEIKDEKFEVSATIPYDISYADTPGRISLYAINTTNKKEYSGIYEKIVLNGTDLTAAEDTISPEVLLYVDTEDFPNGGSVLRDFTLKARITDNTGINSAGNGLGHGMRLTIDGDTNNAIDLNDYFEYDFGSHLSGVVTYPISNMPPGLHNLTLRVWDICNNSTLAPLSIMVQSTEAPPFSISTTENPVRNSTSIIVSLQNEHDSSPLHIYIYTPAGKLIWEKTIPITADQRYASVPWHSCTLKGAALTDGIYLIRAVQGKQHTKTKKIIVDRQ